MKLKLTFFNALQLFFVTLLLCACSSSQEITASWVDKKNLKPEPYKSVFVFAIVQDNVLRTNVENKLAQLIEKRGKKVVKMSDLIPAQLSDVSVTKDQLLKIIKDSGCEMVFTISLLDVKTTERYQAGSTAYAPYGYGYYGSPYGYYGYYSPQVYTPGYYVTDKTYYVETNFYDSASDKLICSFQSSAYNPSNFNSWFADYSHLILYQLRKEKLIRDK